MPLKEMKIKKMYNKDRTTHFNATTPNGKTKRYMVCWWPPKITTGEVTLGGELVADMIEREYPELKAKLQKISDDMKKRICDDVAKFLADTAKPTKQP